MISRGHLWREQPKGEEEEEDEKEEKKEEVCNDSGVRENFGFSNLKILRKLNRKKSTGSPAPFHRINLRAATLCQVGLAHSAKAAKYFRHALLYANPFHQPKYTGKSGGVRLNDASCFLKRGPLRLLHPVPAFHSHGGGTGSTLHHPSTCLMTFQLPFSRQARHCLGQLMDSYCLQQSVSEVFNNQLCVRFTRRLTLHEGMSHLQCHHLQMGLPFLWQPRGAPLQTLAHILFFHIYIEIYIYLYISSSCHFKSKYTVGARSTAAFCWVHRMKKDVMESYSAAEDNDLDAYVFILSTGSRTLSACLICFFLGVELKRRKKKA